LRALVMHLDGLSREQVLELEIPTGVPLLYDVALDGHVAGKRYL
jgi:2,3-bisphosphoglycerate-dependent phosphoglycerate mutase